MIKKWIHAVVALNAENEAIGIIYMEGNVNPYPMIKSPEKVTQTLKTLPRIERVHHPPTQEQIKKAYGQ